MTATHVLAIRNADARRKLKEQTEQLRAMGVEFELQPLAPRNPATSSVQELENFTVVMDAVLTQCKTKKKPAQAA